MSTTSCARWGLGLVLGFVAIGAACTNAPGPSQGDPAGSGGEATAGASGTSGTATAGTTGAAGATAPGAAGTTATGAAGATAPGVAGTTATGAAETAATGAAGTAGATGANGSAGTGASTDAGGTDGGEAPAPGIPTMVAVGWGGVRVQSTDAGKTWGNRAQLATGPDEPTLLRAVTYGAGVWVAVGVPLFTSPDGATWTPRDNPTKTQYGTQWFGGVAFGNGRFVAAGGCGVTMWSTDAGATWTLGPELSVGNCMDHMRSVAFGGGQFAAAGDKKIVHVTTDGVTWSVLAGLATGSVAFCDGAFKDAAACPAPTAEGVLLRSGGGWPMGSIERSTNGKDWQRVHDDTNPIAAFGFGF